MDVYTLCISEGMGRAPGCTGYGRGTPYMRRKSAYKRGPRPHPDPGTWSPLLYINFRRIEMITCFGTGSRSLVMTARLKPQWCGYRNIQETTRKLSWVQQ